MSNLPPLPSLPTGGAASSGPVNSLGPTKLHVGGINALLGQQVVPPGQTLTVDQATQVLLKQGGPALLGQIQYELLQGGFYPATYSPVLGVLTATDESALRKALTAAATAGMPINEYLDQAVSFGSTSGISSSGLSYKAPKAYEKYHTSKGFHEINLTNPEDLTTAAAKAFESALGRAPTTAEAQKFVSEFQGYERNYYQQRYGAEDAFNNAYYAQENQGVAAHNQQIYAENQANANLNAQKAAMAGGQFALGNPAAEQSEITGYTPPPGGPGGFHLSGPGAQRNTPPPVLAPAGINSMLAGLRQVENGGKYGWSPNAIGARGAYQFLPATWQEAASLAGIDPADHSPQAQDAAAKALVTHYYHEFGGNWSLVAAAWQAGPGAARKAEHDPSYLNKIGDGNLTTAQYVQRVLQAASGAQTGTTPALGSPESATATQAVGPQLNGADLAATPPPAAPSQPYTSQTVVETAPPTASTAALMDAVRTNPAGYEAHNVADRFATFLDIIEGKGLGKHVTEPGAEVPVNITGPPNLGAKP